MSYIDHLDLDGYTLRTFLTVLDETSLSQLNRRQQVSRYLVKDFGTSKSPKSTRKRDAYCAPAALRPCRFATPSQARRWLRSTPSNGWTAC